MGNHKRMSIVSAIAILASAYSVHAADYIPEPPVIELPPEEEFGGWYLRGDIGYASISVDEISYFQGSNQTGTFKTHDIDKTWMLSGGVGYQVNDSFRVDWTASYYAEADFTGSTAIKTTCADKRAVKAVCGYSDNSTFKATTFLANAYVDINNWSSFTPYVGAGIGGSYVTWGDLSNRELQVSGPAVGYLIDDTHNGRASWRFAYGLHAGVSYDITQNMKIDAGYSYTAITGGEMVGFGRSSGLAGTQAYDDDIDIHAFRLGLRYEIW